MVNMISVSIGLFYPFYVHRRFNYVYIGLRGSLLMLSCFNLYVAFNPQDNSTLGVVVLVLLPVVGSVFAYVAHRRFLYLDIRVFHQKQKEHDVIAPDERTYGDTNEDFVKNLLARCHVPTDVELATRFCLETSDTALITRGIDVFERGLAKFPKSVYLYARFALYLVFVAKTHLERLRSLATTEEEERRTSSQIVRTTRLIRHVIRRSRRCISLV